MIEKKYKRLLIFVFITFLMIIISNVAMLFFMVKNNESIKQSQESIRSSLQVDLIKSIDKLNIPENIKVEVSAQINYLNLTNGKDGKSGLNGKDGTNGLNGTNGIDGKDGIDGQNGENGADGLTPIIRCNTKENRWEYRYNEYQSWQALNNEEVPCTIGG